MRRLTTVGGLLVVALTAGSCTDQSAPPTDAAREAHQLRANVASHRTFVAPLRGAAEVPSVPTNAVGTAGFFVSADGQAVDFQLLIGRLNNLSQAHIHLAPPGQNGPVVVWLYPSGPPPVPIPGEFNGVLSEGRFTQANLVGPLAGQPLSVLLEHMRNGNTYVNVHSAQFPGGEIRGQIVSFQPID